MNLEKHFDKVLLFVLFMTLVIIWEVVFFRSGSSAWLENLAGQVLAALLTLMVGSRITTRQTDGGNGNDTQTIKPSASGDGQSLTDRV